MKKWHTDVPPVVVRPPAVDRIVQLLVAVGAALAVQFGALPAECREHAARALASLIGLSW